MTRLMLPLAAALLAGCSINVQDDRHHDDTTSCSVECPGRQEASVTCPADKVPTCVCEPSPAASCATSRAPAK